MRLLPKMSLRLLGILIIGQMAARGGARLTYKDPFAPYQAIMPGQLANVLERYACDPPFTDKTSADTTSCLFKPEGGPIIVIFVQYDHIIRRIGFSVRQGNLHLVDLTQCWGRPTGLVPDVSAYEMGLLDVHWGKQLYIVFDAVQYGDAGRLNYALPISYISIEGHSVSCGLG